MSKRELSHNEEEKLPGSNPIKKVKGSQTSESSANGSLSPPKQRQNQTTNFFRINTIASRTTQESEEEKEAPSIPESEVKLTEIILDSDSDASYYRYSLKLFEIYE